MCIMSSAIHIYCMSVCIVVSTIIVRINSFIVYVNVILNSAWCLIGHTSACWGIYVWVRTCVHVCNCDNCVQRIGSERLTLVLFIKNMVYYMGTSIIIIMQSFSKMYRSRCKARKLLSSDKIRAVHKK